MRIMRCGSGLRRFGHCARRHSCDLASTDPWRLPRAGRYKQLARGVPNESWRAWPHLPAPQLRRQTVVAVVDGVGVVVDVVVDVVVGVVGRSGVVVGVVSGVVVGPGTSAGVVPGVVPGVVVVGPGTSAGVVPGVVPGVVVVGPGTPAGVVVAVVVGSLLEGEAAAWAGTNTALTIGLVHVAGNRTVVATPPIVKIFRSCLRSGPLFELICPLNARLSH